MDNNLVNRIEYFLRNEDYERVNRGLRLSKDNIPYTIKYLDELETYFRDIEEFEKCIVIANMKKQIREHDKNYVLNLN